VYFIIPFYTKLYGMSMEAIIAMTQAVNPMVVFEQVEGNDPDNYKLPNTIHHRIDCLRHRDDRFHRHPVKFGVKRNDEIHI
jgi:hypothetical protein